MSKERLEEIAYNVGVSLDGEKALMSSDDYDFLYNYAIQQTERVEELEKQNKHYQDMLVKIFKIVQNHQIMKISDEDYADAAIFLYKWIYDTGAIDHQKHFSELHGHDEFDSHQISLLLKRHLEETKWF